MDDKKMVDDLVKMLDSGMMQGVGHINVDTDNSMEESKNVRTKKLKEKILLEEQRLQPLLNGVKLTMKRPDGIYRIYSKEQFIGIGIVKDGLLKRDIILE